MESVPPELTLAVGNRMRLPFRRFVAGRVLEAAGRRIGGDMRAIEPIRIAGLLESVPILLIHGTADTTIPVADSRRLAAAIGPRAEHWVVPAAGHGMARTTDPDGYDHRMGSFLRLVFSNARTSEPIIGRLVFDDPPDGGQQEGH